MQNQYMDYLLEDDKDVLEEMNKIDSPEERQLIALLLVRNNLKMIRESLDQIKGWVTFFGIIIIVGMILSIFL